MQEMDSSPINGFRIEPGLGHPFSHWTNYPPMKRDKTPSSAIDSSLYQNEQIKSWLLQNLPCFHPGKVFWTTTSMKTFVNTIHSYHKVISEFSETSMEIETPSKNKNDAGLFQKNLISTSEDDNNKFFKLLETDICSFRARHSKGACYSWGTNNQGQLGSIGLVHDGLHQFSQHKKHLMYHPRLLLPIKNCIITAVACGHSHSLAVTIDR
jgi:hypothetical protein